MGRAAGQLNWEASARDLGDCFPGTEGRLPHRSRIAGKILEKFSSGECLVEVDGCLYMSGHSTSANCNCRTDTMAQAMGIQTEIQPVRARQRQHFVESGEGLWLAKEVLMGARAAPLSEATVFEMDRFVAADVDGSEDAQLLQQIKAMLDKPCPVAGPRVRTVRQPSLAQAFGETHS